MARRRHSKLTIAHREALPGASLAAARETDEALRAWQQAFAERVELPAPASVIGEPVTVVDIDYAGNPRRGVIACCRCPDGREYIVSLAEVGFADGSEGARPVARWDARVQAHRAPAVAYSMLTRWLLDRGVTFVDAALVDHEPTKGWADPGLREYQAAALCHSR